MIRHLWNFVAIFWVGVLLVGCSDGRPKLVPVAGQVLIDGKPMTHGFIRFAAAGNRPATGQIDGEGRFTLTTYESDDGAVVGTHQVLISTQEQVGDDQYKWHAPKRYANYSTSGIIQNITGPTDSLVIELTWGNERPPK